METTEGRSKRDASQNRRRTKWFFLAFTFAMSLSAVGQQVIDTVRVGSAPRTVLVNPVTNKIYIANWAGQSVTVIDGATDRTMRVSIPQIDVLGLAVNSVTNKIYVTDDASNGLTVIDGATLATNTVMVGGDARAVAVNSVNNKIYVPSPFGNVAIIDGATLATTTLDIPGDLTTVAVNPITNKIYVGDLFSNRVTVIDGATLATQAVTIASSGSIALAVNPVTNKIYAASHPLAGNVVTVIDGASLSTTTITVGQYPNDIAVNSVTNKIYVACGIGVVTVIDGATNGTANVAAGLGLSALAVDPGRNRIYSIDGQNNKVVVIDGGDLSTTTVGVGVDPDAVAINLVTDRVYVANYGDNTVSVIGPATYDLSISKTGTGAVYSGDGFINCGSACSHIYPSGTKLALTAMPSVGFTFDSWAGCASTQGTVCTAIVNATTQLMSAFSPVTVTFGSLTLSPSTIRQGKNAVGTLALAVPAPPGGVTLSVTSSKPSAVTVPSTIYLPGGASTSKFAVRAISPRPTAVTITVSDGHTAVSSVLNVAPNSSANNPSTGAPAVTAPVVPKALNSVHRGAARAGVSIE